MNVWFTSNTFIHRKSDSDCFMNSQIAMSIVRFFKISMNIARNECSKQFNRRRIVVNVHHFPMPEKGTLFKLVPSHRRKRETSLHSNYLQICNIRYVIYWCDQYVLKSKMRTRMKGVGVIWESKLPHQKMSSWRCVKTCRLPCHDPREEVRYDGIAMSWVIQNWEQTNKQTNEVYWTEFVIVDVKISGGKNCYYRIAGHRNFRC